MIFTLLPIASIIRTVVIAGIIVAIDMQFNLGITEMAIQIMIETFGIGIDTFLNNAL